MAPTFSRVTVDSLPVELLRDIMLIDAFTIQGWHYFGIPGEFHDPKADDGDVYDVKKMVLSAVSRRWRRVALENARLWASFRVGIGPQQYSNMIEALVERSGTLPLDVILFMGPKPLDEEPDQRGWYVHSAALYDRIVRALVSHAARIRTLRVDLRGPVDGVHDLLDDHVVFSILREFRIARDFEFERFRWGPDEDENHKQILSLSFAAPRLKILDLVRLYPSRVAPTANLLHAGIRSLRIVGRLDFSGDPDLGLDLEEYLLPEQTLPLLSKVFSACPALRTLSVEHDSHYSGIDLRVHPGLLEQFPLRSLQKLVLRFSTSEVSVILDSLSHAFIPDVTVIVQEPVEFDLESDEGHPLLGRLMRGMGELVDFDITSFYTVTLRDARGNSRRMGTSHETVAHYVPPTDTTQHWKHTDLWNFLSRRQNLRNNVRTITINNRSWFAWAAILESARPHLDIDELRIVDGAWEFVDEDSAEDEPTSEDAADEEPKTKLLYYELLYGGDQSRQMRSLRFGKLGRIVLEHKFPQFESQDVEDILAYVHCDSGAPSLPVCCCKVAGMLEDQEEIELEESTWPLCDRRCMDR